MAVSDSLTSPATLKACRGAGVRQGSLAPAHLHPAPAAWTGFRNEIRYLLGTRFLSVLSSAEGRGPGRAQGRGQGLSWPAQGTVCVQVAATGWVVGDEGPVHRLPQAACLRTG